MLWKLSRIYPNLLYLYTVWCGFEFWAFWYNVFNLSYVMKLICPITGVDTALAVTRVRSPWFTVVNCMWQGMAVPRFNTWVLSGYSGFLQHQWPPGIYWFKLAYAYNNITTFSKSTCITFFSKNFNVFLFIEWIFVFLSKSIWKRTSFN